MCSIGSPLLGKAEPGTIINDKMSNGDFGPLDWDAPTTETPLLGSTEQWEMFNFTEDSHPIHLHLTQYQVVGKWHIDFLDEDGNGIPDDTNHDGVISYGTGSTPNSPLPSPGVSISHRSQLQTPRNDKVAAHRLR